MAEILPRFDYRVSVAVATDIGPTRSENQDYALAAPEISMFALADGMGGHPSGRLAAEIAVAEARESVGGKTSQRALDAFVGSADLESRRHVLARLRRAIERSNERLRVHGDANPADAGLGSTLDLICLARDRAFIAHAGDARIYLARSRAMLQLTQDHAQLEMLKSSGVVRPKSKARKNDRLINAVGLGETVNADTLFVDLHSGDRLLMCTDGVHGPIADEAEIGEILREGSAEQAANALVKRGVETGRDNATAIVIEICDRFVQRRDSDLGFSDDSLKPAQTSELLRDLSLAHVLATLAAAVEIELGVGAKVPRAVANDLVAYIVIDGVIRCDELRRVSTGAVLYPESLVGVSGRGEQAMVEDTSRLLRVRADDFSEVCASDGTLAVELYRRLAMLLARRA